MSRVCSVCNKGQLSGNKVSHSNRKYRRSWGVNVQKVKVVRNFLPDYVFLVHFKLI